MASIEPYVVVPDPFGREPLTLPLREFFEMQTEARKVARGMIAGDVSARAALEIVFDRAVAPEASRGRARSILSAYLLEQAMAEERERAGSPMIVEAPAEPSRCDHPPDIPCDLCLDAWQARQAEAGER